MNKGLVLAGLVAASCAALLVAASSPARGIREGGTFRLAAQDPSLGPLNEGGYDLTRPACATLMGYPDEPLPAGLRLTPELAASDPRVSRDGKTYTFTIRKDARFSTGAPVKARDLARAFERLLSPDVESGWAYLFQDIVGAQKLQAGKTTSLTGAIAKGRTLTLRLTKPVPDLPARTSVVCAVPANVPADPEGAKAPLPSAAPYYAAEYVPGERLVLVRNRYYRGSRPHHVDRIVEDLAADADTAADQVASGAIEYVYPGPPLVPRLPELVRRYGVNRSQFFVEPALGGLMFFLNTSRPLFHENTKLRQALNFAVDRKALVRALGPYTAVATDQFLPPIMPGFDNERIYPLDGDIAKARALARGRTRGGKAVLYIKTGVFNEAVAQILRRNLQAIGLDVEIKEFPGPVLYDKAATPGEPYDIILAGWIAGYDDPREMLEPFDGRTVNFSRFNSPHYNRLLDEAARLKGAKRYDAYGRLDVQLAGDAAPAIPYAVFNEFAFVSRNVGCAVNNPHLDLTAVCLK